MSIRCDKCAVRLEADQEFCHKCGTRNSDYKPPRRKKTGRSGLPPSGTKENGKKRAVNPMAVIAVLVIAAAIGIIYKSDLTLPGLSPSLREKVFGPEAAVKGAACDYLDAWKNGDIRTLTAIAGENRGASEPISRTYKRYPVVLWKYTIDAVSTKKNSGIAVATVTCTDIGRAAQIVASAPNRNGGRMEQAVKAALNGARKTTFSTIFKAKKQTNGSWRLTSFPTPTAETVILSALRERDRRMGKAVTPVSGDVRLGTSELQCIADPSGYIKVTGKVSNKGLSPSGPYRIVVSFYDYDDKLLAKAFSVMPGLEGLESSPFECYATKVDATVQRYTVMVENLMED